MLSNIFVILLIIVLSYIFKMNEKMHFDNQIMFIFLAIIIMVAYKYLNVQKMVKKKDNFEGFQDDLSNVVNDFADPNKKEDTTMQNSKEADQEEQLNKFQNMVFDLQEKIANLEEKTLSNNIDEKALTNINSVEVNQMQNNELERLRRLIDQVKLQIKEKTSQSIDKQYKKIPVYNSCIVSNADGSTSAVHNNSVEEDTKTKKK